MQCCCKSMSKSFQLCMHVATLSERERDYSVIEKDCLAIVWAVKNSKHINTVELLFLRLIIKFWFISVEQRSQIED